MHSVIVALLLAAGGVANASPDPEFIAQGASACASPIQGRPEVRGIKVTPFSAEAGDLAALKVEDIGSGGWMNVYYDSASESVAWARAACLGAQLTLLVQETGDDRRNARWSSVVFTRRHDYIPPRDGSDVRWVITTTPGVGLDDGKQEMLVAVIPHEQVHAFQGRAGAETPRWFHEGHAEWIGRRITNALAPREAAVWADRSRTALAASTEPVALKRWGSISVKREAILRQVSAADRQRMEADATFVPSGPFSFGPEDMESDESNIAARYQASWRVFRDLAQLHGAGVVGDWVREVTATKGRVSTEAIVASGQKALGEDLSSRLD